MEHDVSRLEALYKAVGPSLFAHLQDRLRDAHAAEDSLQETFLQAARQPQRLFEARSPKAWLFAIARNIAHTALRQRRRVGALTEELARPETPVDPRLEDVRQAIGRLPPAQREALELRVRAELSYEEIAAVLQVPVGTVRSRLHHAVRQLRDELGSRRD